MTSAIDQRSFQQVNTAIALAMVFLMLFLSCNIRKAIQISLDIPVSKPLNQTKAPVSSVQGCALENVLPGPNAAEHLTFTVAFCAIIILAFIFFQTVLPIRVCREIIFPPNSITPLFLRYRKILI